MYILSLVIAIGQCLVLSLSSLPPDEGKDVCCEDEEEEQS